ncbi:MAG: MBL fold metallo-hydrolase [Myxococcales bacterium]|nr:MBL fold metallo-hydrolase [Myxococcales bacterium]
MRGRRAARVADAASPADAAPVDAAAPDAGPPDLDAPADAGVGGVEALAAHCASAIGPPRVEEVAPDVFVAIGYDLANTILLRTADGNVIVDAGMSPARARATRAALDAVAPGPVRAVIYTHSHIDHVGGASVWVEPGTEVWATEAFLAHLLKQYGAFREAESARGALQFGQGLPDEALPCSALGRRADVDAALETGVRLPTHTFSGEAALEVGGTVIQLVEAHGETHDQLFVWLPAAGVLLPGDNVYAAFPNLYTIRGTSPRPVDAWIASLDAMRARDPAILVPSHTAPIVGRPEVQARLTACRDAIQWLRDAVVRGANAGVSVDALVETTRLPPHLADAPGLAELYGQVDWSVRALYDGALGWFDGRPERLYPPSDVDAREIELMGGPEAVLATAESALRRGDARFAAHLLGRLRDAGLVDAATLDPRRAQALRAVAGSVANSNGRAYLLASALALTEGPHPVGQVVFDDAFVAELPVSVIFEVMPGRLKAEQAQAEHLALALVLTAPDARYTLTIRRGVLEVVEGAPLPGTPAPISTITTSTDTWKRLTLGLLAPAAALGEGRLQASDLPGALRFLGLFRTGT